MMENAKSGSLQKAVNHFLEQHQCIETYNHCVSVGDYAYQLGEHILDHPSKARIAGLLHDVSAIYPNNQRIDVANKLGIQLYKEELEFPMIIHQKLSKQIAISEFNISDSEILLAIECHTTLRAGYSDLDLVVFVADKIKWDQEGEPPYLEGLLKALDQSLEHAAYYYIDFILNNGIKVIHPWLWDAYLEIGDKIF
jgi:predicted HD superfamily hydrolase involved in NAD metabolism